jgi:hypothetical protein
MALYNEIFAARFNRALQKTFGMKGGPPAPQLAGEVAATISHFWGIEQRYPEGWGRFAATSQQGAGGAGTRASVRIDNPKSSKIIAVIEKLMIVATAGGAQDTPFLTYSIISAGDQAGAPVLANTGLDQRGPQTPQLHITSQATAAAVLGVTIMNFQLQPNTQFDVILLEDHELPLMPNSSYTLYSNVLNQGLAVNILWRERPQEDSEVT